MPKWLTKKIYHSGNLHISKSTAGGKGDVFNPATMLDRSGGVHFLSTGSLKLLNIDATVTGAFGRGQQVGFVDVLDYQARQAILIANEPLEFYCITDPDLQTEWTGTIHDLSSSESLELTAALGSKIFIAEGSVIVNGTEHAQHSILSIESVDSVSVIAGSNGAMLTNFKAV